MSIQYQLFYIGDCFKLNGCFVGFLEPTQGVTVVLSVRCDQLIKPPPTFALPTILASWFLLSMMEEQLIPRVSGCRTNER